MADEKKLAVVFYRSSSGAEPVLEWLRELSPADRQILGRELRLVEMGWPVGMPLCGWWRWALGDAQFSHRPPHCTRSLLRC